MEHVFARKTGQGILSIALGLVFIYMGFNHNPASPIPFWLKYAMGVLSLVYGVGQVVYPLCAISADQIVVRINPFMPKTMAMNQLTGIEIGDKQVTLYADNDEDLVIPFRHLNEETKARMIQAFEQLKKH